jgi:glutaconate CoA-transferase subunit B
MTARHTLHDIITVAVARSLKDGEVGFTGLATGGPAALFATAIPLAAMGLARRMQAPNLTILLAGWCHNPDLSRLDALPDAEFDSRMRDLECEAQMIEYPGQFALKRGDIDFGFSSGVQVDRQGNLNSVCVGPYERPKVRLVGPILVPEHMTLFRREYVMMPHHEARNLVERVDFVAGVGYPGGEAGRRALGLDVGARLGRSGDGGHAEVHLRLRPRGGHDARAHHTPGRHPGGTAGGHRIRPGRAGRRAEHAGADRRGARDPEARRRPEGNPAAAPVNPCRRLVVIADRGFCLSRAGAG